MSEPVFAAWDSFVIRSALGELTTGAAGALAGSAAENVCAAAADPALAESIDVATPHLARVLDAAARGDSVKPAQLRRADLAAHRYRIRRATRPTPFGLFAGVAPGTFGDVVKFAPGEAHRRRTRLDAGWAYQVVHDLESRPDVLRGSRLQAHQALVTRGDRVVLETPSTQGVPPGKSGATVVSVRRTPLLTAILNVARDPVPHPELLERVVARFPDRANASRLAPVVAKLVEQGLLVSDLRPDLGAGDPLRDLIVRLRALPERTPGTAACLDELVEVDRLRDAYDATQIGGGRAALARLRERAGAVARQDNLVHVDVRLDLEVTLPRAIAEETERAADALWRLSTPRLGMRPLRRFHERFLDRFGADRLVPVLELLDEHHGLGPPNGYEWPTSEAPVSRLDEPVTERRNRTLAGLASTALRTGSREVVLDEELLGELGHDTADVADVPNSCELYVHVEAGSDDDLTDGRFRIWLSPSPGSHTAGATGARFHDLLDDPDRDAVPGPRPVHVPGARFADVVFEPRAAKAANLAATRPMTGLRIAVGVPDTPGTTAVRITDLAVGADLTRLYVVDTSVGEEIVPLMPTMVSPATQAPNVARFLWEVGMEGQRLWEPWNWGPVEEMPFLPRVRYGRVVLSPARWLLDELRGEPDGDWAGAVAAWRERWGVPRDVLAVSADQRLRLDLTHAHDLAVLADEIRKDPQLLAYEVPTAPDDVPGAALGGRASEVIIPMVRRDGAAHRMPRATPVRVRPVHRGPLGAEWTYVNVHGTRRTQDDLLRTHVAELVAAAREAGADRWFFVRYTDPEGHLLRLRLRTAPDAPSGPVRDVVTARLARWQDAGLVGRYSGDQYEPEADRYGGPDLIDDAEALFDADSDAALALLELARRPNGPNLEDLGAVSAAALAHALGPPGTPVPGPDGDRPGEHAAVWLSLTGTRRTLPPEYRTRAAELRGLVDPHGGWPTLSADDHGRAVLATVGARDAAAARFGAAVRLAAANGSLCSTEPRIVASLLHMTCNRMFGGSSETEASVLGRARGALQDNARRRSHT